MNISTIKKIIKRTVLGKSVAKYYHQYIITRPKKSYSQVGEDIIVDYILDGKKNGFYVDIGAYHPVHLSNTCFFYRKGWSGIQVEPNKKRAALFIKARPSTITVQVGIAAEEKEQDYYVFKEEALNTFSKEVMETQTNLGHEVIQIQKVKTMPLSTILNKYATKHIDILSVDVEGYDLEVLKTNNWNLFRPTIIILETAQYKQSGLGGKLNTIYDPYIQTLGYEKIADTHLNTIYIDIKPLI